MNIRERLLEVFEQLHINQTTFAKEIGISPGNISDIMNGRSNPSAITLKRIYEIYKININWLLSGDGDIFVTHNENDKITLKQSIPLINQLADLNVEDKNKVLDFIKNLLK